ncbi:hypothetical protein ACWDCC_13720 [Streptomyces sp. NPDC001102]
MTDHEDRKSTVITAPVIHELGGAPSHEHRTGCVPFLLELRGRPRRRTALVLQAGPLVQSFAIVSAQKIVGIGDLSVD